MLLTFLPNHGPTKKACDFHLRPSVILLVRVLVIHPSQPSRKAVRFWLMRSEPVLNPHSTRTEPAIAATCVDTDVISLCLRSKCVILFITFSVCFSQKFVSFVLLFDHCPVFTTRSQQDTNRLNLVAKSRNRTGPLAYETSVLPSHSPATDFYLLYNLFSSWTTFFETFSKLRILCGV